MTARAPLNGEWSALKSSCRLPVPKTVPPYATYALISQIMTIQSIKRRTDLHQPVIKIYGTRPSGVYTPARRAMSEH